MGIHSTSSSRSAWRVVLLCWCIDMLVFGVLICGVVVGCVDVVCWKTKAKIYMKSLHGKKNWGILRQNFLPFWAGEVGAWLPPPSISFGGGWDHRTIEMLLLLALRFWSALLNGVTDWLIGRLSSCPLYFIVSFAVPSKEISTHTVPHYDVGFCSKNALSCFADLQKGGTTV